MCQNVFNEVLSVWFKFQAKTPKEELKDIGNSMNIGNLILGVNSVTVSYLIRYDSLLQNVTDIIAKCDSYFITKCNRNLLQNGSCFLLQNATVLLLNATVNTNCNDSVTKCDSYYKMRRFITNYDSTFTL